MEKVKISVVFYNGEKTLSPFKSLFKDPQEKVFEDKDSCIVWCRRNQDKIHSLNNFRTFGEPISHFKTHATRPCSLM